MHGTSFRPITPRSLPEKGYWVNIFNTIRNIGRTTQVMLIFTNLCSAGLSLAERLHHSSVQWAIYIGYYFLFSIITVKVQWAKKENNSQYIYGPFNGPCGWCWHGRDTVVLQCPFNRCLLPSRRAMRLGLLYLSRVSSHGN